MLVTSEILDWLLDSDPSVRYQVLRDLTDAPADQVAGERARIATEGWGERLLDTRAAILSGDLPTSMQTGAATTIGVIAWRWQVDLKRNHLKATFKVLLFTQNFA